MKFNSKRIISLFTNNNFLTFRVVSTYKDYGITWDESFNRDLGLAVDYYATFGKDTNYMKYYAGNPQHYMTHGPIVQIIVTLVLRMFNNSSYENYHFILGILALLTFIVVYQTIKLITNNSFISLFGMILLSTMPRFYGDMFNNSLDIPSVLFTGLVILLSIRILIKSSHDTILNFIFLGIIAGISASQRIAIAYTYFIFIFIFMVRFVLLNRKSFVVKNLVIVTYKVMLSFLLMLIFLHLLNPYLLMHPIVGIYDMVLASIKYPWSGNVLFEGVNFNSLHLPWYYLIKWLIISIPEIILVLFLIGSLFLLHDLRKKGNEFIGVYLLLTAYLPIILYNYHKPVDYDAWRHFLFLSFPIIIISAIGFYRIISQKYTYLSIAIFVITAVELLNIASEMNYLHPYEYVYFNRLVGGLNGAYTRYETDYWGQSLKESTLWLKSKTYMEPSVKVFACANQISSSYFFSDNMKLSKIDDDPDFSVCITRGMTVPLLLNDLRYVYVVQRHKVPLSYVYKYH